MARKNLPSYKNRYAKSHNGLPFGTAPTHKAVGRIFFCGLPSANCGLRTAVCEISITPNRRIDYRHTGYRRTGYRRTGCRHQGYPNSRRNRVRPVLVLCSVRGVRAG